MKIVKFISIIGIIVFSFMFDNLIYAQISKAEAKVLKKQLKKMSLEEYTRLKQNVNKLKSDSRKLNNEFNQLKKNKLKQSQQSDQLTKKFEESQEKILKLKIESETSTSNTNDVDNTANTPSNQQQSGINGIVFRVQIGAYNNKDLANFFPNNSNFDGQTAYNIESYTVGSFTDYWEADAFKKLIRKMGASDVRVIAYKDGLRTPMREILEALRLL